MRCVQFRDVECPWYRELYEVSEFECEDCPVMQEAREERERQEVETMWDKLRRRWPRLYEALEWVTFALALGAFLLALGVYLSVRA